jgi:hypothetical protein
MKTLHCIGTAAAALALFTLAGCAALNFTPTTAEKLSAARKDGTAVGYPVYEPRTLLIIDNSEGKCTTTKLVVPNYDRPVMVNISSGWGSSTIDFELAEGWTLSKASVQADNTALLDKLDKLITGPGAKALLPDSKGSECKTGVYELAGTGKDFKLKRLNE